MPFNPAIHRRKSIRLRTRDYARPGKYFVTLCVAQKHCLLGEIRGGVSVWSGYGKIAAEEWVALEKRFAMVRLDAWVVMPNHVHGILELVASATPRGKSLGAIVGAFKTASSRRINAQAGTIGGSIWQRNFHERVLRDGVELDRVRQYIRENPACWATDEENPSNHGLDHLDLSTPM